MASELVIRVQRDDGPACVPQVKVEVNGKPIGMLSRLLFVADNQRIAPHIEAEFLRGFVLRQDLHEDTEEHLQEYVEALRECGVDVKYPV